ncbi:MAG: hypothetical protein CNE89_00390 [Sphingomonadaceae bacterium MED-G03]|nr:MAG: hypothetical protein CNE89_00390 [Sphingomonadaceae bacterium MED-G03]
MPLLATLLIAAATPACAAPAPIAEPWTAWSQTGEANAGIDATDAPALVPGKPMETVLVPVGQVRFAAVPGKGAKEGYGGLFSLSLKEPGRVGIALSGAAWVDVVTEAKAAASVEHGHGPECSGIRKIVWFDLSAGRHIIQIAGAQARSIHVMAAEAEASQGTQ